MNDKRFWDYIQVEPGLEFFASEYTWRVFAQSKDEWLVHTVPNGTYDTLWRCVPRIWIVDMLEKYR